MPVVKKPSKAIISENQYRNVQRRSFNQLWTNLNISGLTGFLQIKLIFSEIVRC